VFSFNDTRRWYDRVVTAPGGSNSGLANAQSFARFYAIAGMNHRCGDPATDQFDVLTPLAAWVKQGLAPKAITATANAQNAQSGFANRTRPLCAYPQVARYKGTGSLEEASNFVCE